MKKKLILLMLTAVCALALAFGLSACTTEEKGADGHTHTADNYFVDDNAHWKVCDICGETFSQSSHSFGADNSCKTCNFSFVYTDGLKYSEITDNDGNITAYYVSGIGEANDTAVIIPSYYNGKPVTEIGYEAFEGCSGLTSIIIPDSVTSIGDYAFYNCSGLTSITIPDSVTTIGSRAFWDCSGLTDIYYTGDIAGWCGISGLGELMGGNCTLYINENKLTELVIPDSVTTIGRSAFNGCSELKSITIHDSVTSIGGYAFYNTAYYNDTNNWEDGVLYIGKHLIAAQTSVTDNYEIKQGTLTIGDYAFYYCRGLTSITISDSVTTIGDYAFYGCSRLTSITIPDSVTSIGRYAFGDCRGLTSITIPDSVTSIRDYAFYYCSGLTSITIPDSVTSIGSYAFDGCSRLTSITIPDRESINYLHPIKFI